MVSISDVTGLVVVIAELVAFDLAGLTCALLLTDARLDVDAHLITGMLSVK